jgi:hypothetical protein
MRPRPTPAALLALVALFFALGGSAFAVADAVKPQPRCANGAVRGIVAVTGDPAQGMANMPDQFSTSPRLVSRRFTCTGGAPQVRRVSRGEFEVRFPGNRAQSALVSATGALASVQPVGDAFRVSLYVPGRDDRAEVPFVVVLV